MGRIYSSFSFRLSLPDIPKTNKTHYNVALLIIDSLSQQGLQRNLPMTKSYLDSQGGILFLGHHKVGGNSYPNDMALLSGELGGPNPPDHEGIYYLDEERQALIQDVYRNHGYITLYMEDFQLHGTFARKNTIGFKKPPVDIYYRGPFLAMISEWVQNQIVGTYDSYACLQEQLVHKHEFRIIQDFIEMYSNAPNFLVTHLNEYTHNDLNMAKLYDQDMRDMLENIIKSGALDNTFFVLLGDHGFQRAENPFTLTSQGKIEEAMPAFYLIPPKHLAIHNKRILKKLEKNSQMLTSFWDANQMLRDLLALSVENRTTEDLFDQFEGHGTSLLEDVGDRDCEEAEIPAGICQCTDGTEHLNDDEAEKWARTLLLDTNNFLFSNQLRNGFHKS